MARVSMVCFVLAVVAVMLISGGGVWAGDDCQSDIQSLVAQCMEFVMKGGEAVLPSEECCGVVKKVDIPCVCSHVNAEIEMIVDMSKVVSVAETCGRPLDHGSKCGSFTVPMA